MIETASMSGRLIEGRHRLPLRVYYEDTDFSGVVYHASYLRFFERGRTELLRAIGFRQGTLHESAQTRLSFVVRRMTIEFERPARMDDVVLVETAVDEIRGASIAFAQTLARDDERLASCRALVAAVVDGRPQRVPADLKTAFASLRAP